MTIWSSTFEKYCVNVLSCASTHKPTLRPVPHAARKKPDKGLGQGICDRQSPQRAQPRAPLPLKGDYAGRR